jgi:hypothetical protein
MTQYTRIRIIIHPELDIHNLNYWGVHPVARVSSNVNKPPYATMFGARFYCALTLHVSAPIGGHPQVLCDKIYSKVATFMSTDALSPHIDSQDYGTRLYTSTQWIR